MAALRALGDGPEYWKWQQGISRAPEDRRVALITNMENRMKDLELYEYVGTDSDAMRQDPNED